MVSGVSRTLPRATLICVGAFPGIHRFIGLGQLTEGRLATLTGTGVPVTAGHGSDPGGLRVAITETGRDLLAGRTDHLQLNGIDVWGGGVHLTGSDGSPWRWDAGRETLVS